MSGQPPKPAAAPALSPAGKANGALAANDPIASLRSFLAARTKNLADALPKTKGLSADKFIKLALLAATKNPDILKCALPSVFQCLMQAAELGLEPSGSLGAAYLVPYGQVCTLVIGYRGYIDLARRSGVLNQIEAHVVHKSDTFTYRIESDGTRLQHIPTLEGQPGEPWAVYCIARLANGNHIEVMSIQEVEKIRSKIPGGGRKGPWADHWGEMAKKTVARRALKWVPMSSELQRALDIEDGNEMDIGGSSTAGPPLDLGALEVRAPTVSPMSPAGRAAAGKLTKAEKEAAEIADWAEAGGPSPAETVDPQTGEVLSAKEPEPPPPPELTPAEQAIEAVLGGAKSGAEAMPAIALIGKLPTVELKAYWKDRYNITVRGFGK